MTSLSPKVRITKIADARRHIGSRVSIRRRNEPAEWAVVGILREAAGRNVRIDMNWHWLPDSVLLLLHPTQDQSNDP